MALTPRHLFVAVGRGALLLDLKSGALLELNESAAFVWERSIAGRERESLIREVSNRYGIDPAASTDHVRAALEMPTESVELPPTDFNYRQESDHYVFEFRNEPIFAVDSMGESVSLFSDASVRSESLAGLLHALAPKILSLRGHVVLHAAAIALADKALAFSGLSGAGKSTTARAFLAAGATLISDDQLVLDTKATPISVRRRAEVVVQDWIVGASHELLASGRARCSPIDGVHKTERLTLAEIGFFNSNRRRGSGFLSAELSPVDVAGATFRHAFHGSNEPSYWRRALQTAAQLGNSLKGFEVTAPATIDDLWKAAASCASRKTLTR